MAKKNKSKIVAMGIALLSNINNSASTDTITVEVTNDLTEGSRKFLIILTIFLIKH